MKANDFQAGDRCKAITPSDTVDNVLFQSSDWVSGATYKVGNKVNSAGVDWFSLTEHTDAIAPVEGAIWTRNGIPLAAPLPSLIYCNGVTGNVKVTTYKDDVVTLAIPANGFLALASLRVKRVWSTGTTATLLFAIAE